ncbi:MAG: CDP-alcohol phosphatidyltransferase family protein [Candidatus Aenigmarchaeota archaeon]|nr:CDP-alcohol phosphatidyltransferase family protein [Candidatus Aenigmarchaeota archaeon]
MPRIPFFNLANQISLFRIALVLAISYILFIDSISFPFLSIKRLRVLAFFLAILAIVLDYVDGFIARRDNVGTKVGGVMDVLADRIVENIFWISFAILGLVHPAIPILILIRGLSTDALRSFAYARGATTFGMMNSFWGKLLVSSRISRGISGGSKLITFPLVIFQYAFQLSYMTDIVTGFVLFTAAFTILRGILVIYDSRRLFL